HAALSAVSLRGALPPWAPADAVKLRIEAGAGFGTGHHGTTVGCLQAYNDLLKGHRFARVLDVGEAVAFQQVVVGLQAADRGAVVDRKSTRLHSSHVKTS